MVVRDGKEVIRSKPLQHYFDCPLQFGAFPEFVEATDTADMADLYSITLKPGDVIVAGGCAEGAGLLAQANGIDSLGQPHLYRHVPWRWLLLLKRLGSTGFHLALLMHGPRWLVL